MNTEGWIRVPQCSTIDLSALCNSSNSIWKTIESHRCVKLSCENIGMCLSYVPLRWLYGSLIDGILYRYDMTTILLSSQWDNDNQHFVYIIVSWYLLGIITCQGFLFSCSCMNRCTCFTSYTFPWKITVQLLKQTTMETQNWVYFALLCLYFDNLVQDCSNSSALAMELLQSCAKAIDLFLVV